MRAWFTIFFVFCALGSSRAWSETEEVQVTFDGDEEIVAGANDSEEEVKFDEEEAPGKEELAPIETEHDYSTSLVTFPSFCLLLIAFNVRWRKAAAKKDTKEKTTKAEED